MLKGRWGLTHKKCECKLYNARYVTMAAAVLHNICIYRNDPCNHSRRLKGENFGLGSLETQRWEGQNSKNKSLEVSRKISN